jgi:large subunit ribosomal protein L7/L12
MAAKTLDSLISEISNLTVLELAQLVKALEEKFGVSAAAPAAAAAPVAQEVSGSKAEEEKSQYKVELLDGGADKRKVIMALRTVKKDLGLLDAKKLVEEAPAVLADAATKDEAFAMKKVLEEAGAKIKLS